MVIYEESAVFSSFTFRVHAYYLVGKTGVANDVKKSRCSRSNIVHIICLTLQIYFSKKYKTLFTVI